MKGYLLAILVLTYSCKSKSVEPGSYPSDEVKAKSKIALNDSAKYSSIRALKNGNEILGLWESENKEPLTIKIERDSFYYTEHFEAYKYKIKRDSIFINYPDFVFAAKVYFENDTLVMESEDGKEKFTRFNR